MKRIFSLFFVLFTFSVYAQINEEGNWLETDYRPEYYRLEINVNPYQQDFSGTTTMHFRTKSEMNFVEINAKPNLEITSISYHQSNISNYTRNGEVLKIQLPALLPENKLDSISISFSGNANSSHGYLSDSHDNIPVIATLAEPWHASSWWVCKDDLLEKVNKIDVKISHPSEFKAASNGVLKSVNPIGNGFSVTHWQHNYPIPAYLVGIAVTNYAEYNNSVNINGTTIPIVNYLYPETMSNWTAQLDQVPFYIEFLSEKFGEYPFKDEKYGHAQWNKNGGMEHTTMSFMGGFSFILTVHELAHMWFGNKVTCASWHDIWINEGFADYCVGLMNEEINGENNFNNWKENRINLVTQQNYGSVYNPEAENEARTFDSRLTYTKASMAVHLIRYMMNDDPVFYQTLTNFLNHPDFTYGYASTDDFKNFIENETGSDWSNYFNDWIYGEGHPIFDITVNKIPNLNQWQVKFTQNGSHPSVSYFHTPFEIEFEGSGNQKAIRRFNIENQTETFIVDDIPFEITSYLPNPKSDVVCQINSTILNTREINSESIKVYPSPAKDFIKIESDEPVKKLVIRDLTGKVVLNKFNINQKNFSISVKEFTAGVYIITVETSNKTLKIIKIIKN